jgi:hypothetical protein
MDSTLSHLKDLGERVETRQSRGKQCHGSRLRHRVWSSRKREGDAVVPEVDPRRRTAATLDDTSARLLNEGKNRRSCHDLRER